jgi:hypothetical protein
MGQVDTSIRAAVRLSLIAGVVGCGSSPPAVPEAPEAAATAPAAPAPLDRCPEFFPQDCFEQLADRDGCPDPEFAHIEFAPGSIELPAVAVDLLERVAQEARAFAPGVKPLVSASALSEAGVELALARVEVVRAALQRVGLSRVSALVVVHPSGWEQLVEIQVDGCEGEID